MSIPPSYDDLGKSAKDLLSKGYGYGSTKLSVTTKTANGMQFRSTGQSANDTGKVTGAFETQYEHKDYGLTLRETWKTDNVLATNISIQDQFIDGLSLTFDTTFSPSTGKKSAVIEAGYKHHYVHVTGDVAFDVGGPTIHGAAVVGYEGWLAGYYGGYDTGKGRMTASNFSLGYESSDFTLTSAVNNGEEFTGSLYHKVSDSIEAGTELSWASSSNTTSFVVGGKYAFDDGASVRAKLNNKAHIGLGYTQSLRDGVKLTLSSLIDAKNLNQPGHKIGLSLEWEA